MDILFTYSLSVLFILVNKVIVVFHLLLHAQVNLVVQLMTSGSVVSEGRMTI